MIFLEPVVGIRALLSSFSYFYCLLFDFFSVLKCFILSFMGAIVFSSSAETGIFLRWNVLCGNVFCNRVPMLLLVFSLLKLLFYFIFLCLICNEWTRGCPKNYTLWWQCSVPLPGFLSQEWQVFPFLAVLSTSFNLFHRLCCIISFHFLLRCYFAVVRAGLEKCVNILLF